jgi:hypothetical protein
VTVICHSAAHKVLQKQSLPPTGARGREWGRSTGTAAHQVLLLLLLLLQRAAAGVAGCLRKGPNDAVQPFL